MDHSRDPCPWVALSDFGGAFCMGVGASLLTVKRKNKVTNDRTSASRQSEVRYGMVSRDSETAHTERDESAHSRPSKHERQY
jgi:hypothetical protein